jgi:uncharacterized protein (TIRG00374 family)
MSLLTFAVTVAFSYIALNGVHLAQSWHALRGSEYAWLLPALLTLGLALTARALRWRALFAPGRRPPLRSVFGAMMIGYLYNNILPARPGELARVVVLSRRSAAQPVEIVGTALLERIFDLLGILVIFFVAEPWLPPVSWFHAAALVAILLAGGIAATALVLGIFGVSAIHLMLRPLRRLPFLSGERVEKAAVELTHGLSGLRSLSVASLGFLWTIVAWLFTALMAYFVTLAFHLHVPFAAGVLVAVAVGAAMVLPSAPAALGVFEGATLIALKAYRVPHPAALSYALVLHIVNFLPFILAGVAILHYNSRHPPAKAVERSPAPPPRRARVAFMGRRGARV